MKDVMVDLETLGKGSHAVIISVGAVEFDPRTAQLGRHFYEVIDPQSCVDAGLKMDASTVMWWMKQNDKARAAFDKPTKSLGTVLDAFSAWFPEGACVWGNGATFDNVILCNAYKAVGAKQPWPYWGDRCYRTLKNLYPHVKQEQSGVAHNALDDARYQALHAIKLLLAIKV